MLDELGNLQSEGHGISGFETMLSIGLGQEQQFTLILQTLQQLKDVYGDSVDKIVQGNTSNIVFLKSTDDSMIETLSKMSGICHRTYVDGKTVTKDVAAMLKATANEGKVSYNMSTKEEPVITYNDMASIPPCNSIVFRAGDSPIWNRNETALPMSWRLFKNTIINPGKEYSLQTIPTLSTAKDFDVKQNQPNFMKMFEKRLSQAAKADKAMRYYQEVYGLTDDEVQKLDIDVYADNIMELVSSMLNPDVDLTVREENADPSVLDVEPEQTEYTKTAIKDDSVDKAMQEDPRIKSYTEGDKRVYANGTVSRNDLISPTGVSHALDAIISDIYWKNKNYFSRDAEHFRIDSMQNLLSADGRVQYIVRNDNSGDASAIADNPRATGMDPDAAQQTRNDLVVKDAFYRFLVGFQSEWTFANGVFAREMARAQANGNL